MKGCDRVRAIRAVEIIEGGLMTIMDEESGAASLLDTVLYDDVKRPRRSRLERAHLEDPPVVRASGDDRRNADSV